MICAEAFLILSLLLEANNVPDEAKFVRYNLYTIVCKILSIFEEASAYKTGIINKHKLKLYLSKEIEILFEYLSEALQNLEHKNTVE